MFWSMNRFYRSGFFNTPNVCPKEGVGKAAVLGQKAFVQNYNFYVGITDILRLERGGSTMRLKDQ